MKNVDELILEITDRISLPISSDDRFDRAAVIRVMNACLTEQVMPKLIQEGGEYLVHRMVIPLQSSGVPVFPSLRIPIPSRTYGRALRDIKYITDQGNGEYNIWDEINVTLTSVAEMDTYENQSFSCRNPMVCLINDHIRLLGNPDSATGAIVLYYNLDISRLVDKTTEFASVSNISYASGTTTITATAGTEYTSFQAVSGVKFVDLYRRDTGAILRPNVKLTRVDATSFTTTDLTVDDVTELANYQEGLYPVVAPYESSIYIVPAKQCQFSTIPEAFDSILVLETCSRILESLGDVQGLEVVGAMLTKAYNSISISMGNRISGQQKKVTDNRSIASFQRRQGNWYGRSNR